MLFVCHPKISEVLQKHCFQFLLGHLNPQAKLKKMLMQNFGVTNKEHHDMLFTEGVNCESPCVSLSFPRKYAKFYLILIPFLLSSICP